MADKQKKKLKSLGRSCSTESTEYSTTMGRSMKRKKPKERWLLTRKTWKYMADAGRKLIPDGAQNCVEDIPKIEAYFQEVCKKEPRFLLWRKNSYPGALGFRKKRTKDRKGGSCRKAKSSGEVDFMQDSDREKPERPKHLPILTSTPTGTRFDLKKMKEDFLNSPSSSGYLPFIPEGVKVGQNGNAAEEEYEENGEDPEEGQLLTMLEKYLTISEPSAPTMTSPQPSVSAAKPSSGLTAAASTSSANFDFNYQELVEKLQRHLNSVSRNYQSIPTSTTTYSASSGQGGQSGIPFNGNHVQKSLSETLSRYYSQSSNRDKVISDLLTNRKALEKLYFDLRKTKGFRGSRGGTGYTKQYGTGNLGNYTQRLTFEDPRERKVGITRPPPLIEIESETIEITYANSGVQTIPVSEIVLSKCQEDYNKMLAENEDYRGGDSRPVGRRRSSVDDDISQSVSDTIKRYLRMARKKSVDSEKAAGFKRVNYDPNLRNIKAKGETTKPGDDDGLNKGCQTNDDWIVTYRDLKFDEISDVDNDCTSRYSSNRSSVDFVEGTRSTPTSPPAHTKSGHSFFSNLLSKHDKNADKNVSSAAAGGAAAMQKSKSSSSVMHHGSRLMAKKIFRSRSKSQTRPSATPCNWTPQGGCVWNSLSGRQVLVTETTLLQLSEIERKVLQKVAIAKLQALNLGVAVKVPTENVGSAISKPKRRPYLLKRKAITTSIFDTSRKDGEKDGSGPGGLVFGIPLTQCVENDRISKAAAGTFRAGIHGTEDGALGRRGSRASFSSLIDQPRGGDESGSCESLKISGRDRIAGSVPGLLDTISCSSADLHPTHFYGESAVPNILNTCFRYLEQYGMHTLGIFRVGTSRKRIRQLREDFDCGKDINLDEGQCPHDVATLLKEYLRDLPDPLLCRDLYNAFVHTQKIRNRRLQFEALQHLIQLLPPANRDTLHALLCFLSTVARYSNDSRNDSGEIVQGNKMDSNNLATVFAPNILHCIKPNSSKENASDRPEDRIDIINVVRTLIDHCKDLYKVSAELLDEVYVHMMDSFPEALNELMSKRDADESVEELDSESYSAPWTPTLPTSDMSIEQILQNAQTESESTATPTEPKKTWSREEFLHESAATGGPNVGMRIRYKDRIRERSSRRRRDDSASRKRKEEELSSGNTGLHSAMNLISRLRGQKDDDYQYGKNRSSSIESTSSTHTDDLNKILRVSEELSHHDGRRTSLMDNSGVITASLTIPVQQSHNVGIGTYLDEDIPYIEDGDSGRQQLTIGIMKAPAVPPRRRQRSISGSDSSVGSIHPITGSISLVQGYDSAVGSSATYSSPVQNTPTSISSSIADAGMSSPPSWASSPPTSPDSVNTSVNYIPDDNQIPKTRTHRVVTKDSPTLQKVTFTSDLISTTKMKDKPFQRGKPADISKSTSTPQFEERVLRETSFTPSISNIGNDVMRSKTAEFERISAKEGVKVKPGTPISEKKKYTKRRYTESRHQTRHIPDSETLDSVPSTRKDDKVLTQVGPVYKRRELISSVPSK